MVGMNTEKHRRSMQVGICLLVQKKVCCFSRSIMDSCNCLVSRSHCNIRLHRNYSVTSSSFVCSYVCVSCVNKMDVDILSIKLTAEKVSNLIGFFFRSSVRSRVLLCLCLNTKPNRLVCFWCI